MDTIWVWVIKYRIIPLSVQIVFGVTVCVSLKEILYEFLVIWIHSAPCCFPIYIVTEKVKYSKEKVEHEEVTWWTRRHEKNNAQYTHALHALTVWPLICSAFLKKYYNKSHSVHTPKLSLNHLHMHTLTPWKQANNYRIITQEVQKHLRFQKTSYLGTFCPDLCPFFKEYL